jgi:predicted O-linked N-acetylglucosamine transferase (SPINDLY family)
VAEWISSAGERLSKIVAQMAQITIQQAFDLALQHHRAGRLREAENLYKQILAHQPNHADATRLLGVIARQMGRTDIAVDLFRRAIALRPGYPEAHSNLGNALKDKGQLDEAIAAYRQAIALRPGYAEAHSNLGNALNDKGQLDEAIAAYQQAIALDPNLAETHSNLGNALNDKGQLDEAIAAYRQAMTLRPNYTEAHSNLAYTLHFHPSYDAQAIAGEHCRWKSQHAEPLRKFIQPHTNNRDPERRLRIGYVSPDFRKHPVGRFLLPLLAHHDKKQVEVFGYSQVALHDEITDRLRSYTDGWRTILGLSDAGVADVIRQDQIDILVDLAMHMANSRLLVFARKPAPVQVTYLAYCSTTGLDTIDYRLSDPYLDPPGGDESFYSEKTIRLPETYWCYESIIASSEVGPVPALERGVITFGCLNNFCKISEPALGTWAEVLGAVPNSQLLLSAHQGSHRQRVQQRLERDGIEPSRVQFAGRMPLEKYFDLYRRIDIALDTFPYGGGTTTCDALWMGVSVVSLVGTTAVNRGGLSILSNVGVPELTARSKEEYVRLASALAADLPRLRDLRMTLRGRMEQSPLMDAPRFARHIEAAYRQMWRSWCETASVC